MIRTLVVGIVFGIFIGVLLSSRCFANPQTNRIIRDTIIVEYRTLRIDTLVIKEKVKQKVIVKDCKYASIEQTQEGEIMQAEKDSLGFTFTQSQNATTTRTERFGLGVGLFTSWETWRPSLSFTFSYTPTKNIRLQTTVIPTQKTIGINFIGGF